MNFIIFLHTSFEIFLKFILGRKTFKMKKRAICLKFSRESFIDSILGEFILSGIHLYWEKHLKYKNNTQKFIQFELFHF